MNLLIILDIDNIFFQGMNLGHGTQPIEGDFGSHLLLKLRLNKKSKSWKIFIDIFLKVILRWEIIEINYI